MSIPFFRLEINKFLWWKLTDEAQQQAKVLDVRMFVGPWPTIIETSIYGREHGEITANHGTTKVYMGRSSNEALPWWVTGTVVYYTTKEYLIAAGYDFNPNTWQPFIAKLRTDPESKEVAVKCFKNEPYF